MAEFKDIQVLSTISTLAHESELKVHYLELSYKAQEYLFGKLKKRTKRQNEVCCFLNDANLKLQAEINLAEQQVKSFLVDKETIEMANIELKKDLMIAKGKKIKLEGRMKQDEEKYENLWCECRKRYESLPFVQNLLKQKNTAQSLYNNFVNSKVQIESLKKEIKIKTILAFKLDKKRILDLANYITFIMIKKNNIIREKSMLIVQLENEIDIIINEKKSGNSGNLNSKTMENKKPICQDICKPNKSIDNLDKTNNDELFVMPKLQLANFDWDINLEMNNIKNNVATNTAQPKVLFAPDIGTTSQFNLAVGDKSFENKYLSLFYKIPSSDNKETNKTQNYSKRKLINILNDNMITKTESQKILSRIDPDKLKIVDVIAADEAYASPSKQLKLSQENNKLEIIEISTSNTENVLIPPTQFLDMTQDKTIEIDNGEEQNITMQDEEFDKANDISYNIIPGQKCSNPEVNMLEKSIDKYTDETQNHHLGNSAVSEEDYEKVKNKILKERQLDLSPQFVYGKNNRTENIKTVTSKFFQNYIYNSPTPMTVDNNDQSVHVEDKGNKVEANETEQETPLHKDEGEVIKREMPMLKQPVKGLLFNHGSQCIPDSLNISLNTTANEEGDLDYPQFIDSSLLLSPKADLPNPPNNTNQIQSEEVPNFLSGFRKTGLFLFGESASSNQKEENVQQEQSLFNFNFGSKEEKNKGRFFNMFN